GRRHPHRRPVPPALQAPPAHRPLLHPGRVPRPQALRPGRAQVPLGRVRPPRPLLLPRRPASPRPQHRPPPALRHWHTIAPLPLEEGAMPYKHQLVDKAKTGRLLWTARFVVTYPLTHSHTHKLTHSLY